MRGHPLDRHHPNTLVAHHDLISLAHIKKFHRPRGIFLTINRDRAVQHRRQHFDFLVTEPDKRLLIRGHIKTVRKNAIGRCLCQLHIFPFGNLAPVLAKAEEELVEGLTGQRRYLDLGEALIRSLFTDLDFRDLEIGSPGQDLIQHLGQNERVDDMTAQFDRFREHALNLTNQVDRASRHEVPNCSVRLCQAPILIIRRLAQTPLHHSATVHEHLSVLTNKVAAALAVRPEIFITHPAELRILRGMTDQQLREFAAEHGWRVVIRIGGRQIEFYNDASKRVWE